MSEPLANPRNPEFDTDFMFVDRWSPRAFRSEPVGAEDLARLFEAARWTPSCFNDQPWVFLYATSDQDRARFAAILDEANQSWATRAPVLLFILARRNFARTGKPNRYASFDTGAAWMALALQARKLGLHTHAMAGFDRDRAYQELEIPRAEYEVIAAVAVGRRGDPETLPDQLKRIEAPNARRPQSEFVFAGKLGGSTHPVSLRQQARWMSSPRVATPSESGTGKVRPEPADHQTRRP